MIDRFQEIELNRREADAIAQNLQSQLGIPVQNLLQFDTGNNPEIAARVLPLIEQWVTKVSRGDIRATLYTLFQTRHARKYLPCMLAWLQTEAHPPALRALKFAISIAMRASDAELVWEVLKSKDLGAADIPLLLKLAKSKTVGAEVNSLIWAGLGSGTFSVFSFDRISNVHDDRILKELLSRAKDPDPEVRKQVRRLFERGRPLPAPLERARLGPNRRLDLFSTEVDTDQLFTVLTLMETKFGVHLPKQLSDLAFVEALPVNKWVNTPAIGNPDVAYTYWFRLETDEVMEVVLQQDKDPSAGMVGKQGQ